MHISPKHNLPHLTLADLQNLNFLIEIFEAKIDGWYLEVADKCINGWQENEKQCINTFDLQGRPATYIPDSGFAVLMIVFSYFETIGFFKHEETNYFEKLTAGVNDVFPEFANHSINLAKRMNQIRNDLYHMKVPVSGFTLHHTETSLPVEIVATNNAPSNVVIDPHLLIPRLRAHLKEYCDFLRDEKNVEHRIRFHRAFIKAYVKFDIDEKLLWLLINTASPMS